MRVVMCRGFLSMFLVLLIAVVVRGSYRGSIDVGVMSRDEFPEDFVFGSGTSAYQMEGAAFEDGRTPSIWDTFAREGNTKGTGDIASDGYHKYKEDVQLMKETGLDAYRFSISWSRLIPDGRGKINLDGLEYYNNLINELIKHGIEPHVTLYHFDLPQVLQDEYDGWLSPTIVDDFTAYADVCFREFGDRVSHWITLNEVNAIAFGGYDIPLLPPKRCSYPFGNCSSGNSVTEPYTVAHHCLLAHSSVASLYRTRYQVKQQGFIGLNVLVFHFLPQTNSTKDICATKRTQDFFTGWFVEPLVRGRYPKTMRKAAGKKMPRFSLYQSKLLMDSFDFIGVNYYYTFHVKDNPNNVTADRKDFIGDISSTIAGFPPVGVKSLLLAPDAGSSSIVNPAGLQGVLEYLKNSYGNPPIYIHENGLSTTYDVTIDDTPRVKFLSEHLASLRDALRNGSNTRGYFTWSFVDVFELIGGYKFACGLYYVDFNDTARKRHPKLSARWYSNFLKRSMDDIYFRSSASYATEKSSYVLK